MKMESMYEQLGVSTAVYEYGERIIAELRDRQMQPRRPVIPLRISRIFPQPARSIWTS